MRARREPGPSPLGINAVNPLARFVTAALAIPAALALSRCARADSADGTWSDLAPPGRAGYAAIYDPVRDREVIFGGFNPSGGGTRNDTWTLSLAPGGSWTPAATIGAPPAWANNFSALYDPVRDRMIVILGGGQFGVWALDLGTMSWQALAPSGTPPIVYRGASSVYDPVRDRVLVFGGDSTCLHGPCPHNEVWSLSLAGTPAWSLLTVAGAPPPPRFDHAAIYDPIRDRMIVFAGMGEYYAQFNDAWALDLSGTPTWSPLAPTGTAPAPASGYLSLYDPALDQMLVSAASIGSTGLWSLALAGTPAWTAVSPTGPIPHARYGVSLIRDSARARLVMHGGYPVGLEAETWTLDLQPTPTWSLRSVLIPGRRYVTTVLDAATDRMVVFGGMQEQGVFLNDAWARDLTGSGSWTALAPTGTSPAPRWSYSAVVDGPRHRMVLFGGIASTVFNDVWALSLGPSPAWSPLVPVGTPPPPRNGHVAVFDPIGDRMVVFGGAGSSLPQETYNDTWVLSFDPTPTWTQIVPSGIAPSPRFWMAAALDTRRRRMLVLGGVPIGGGGELWSLSLGESPAWTQIVVPGAPPARYLESAVYDPIGDRLLVFGGASDTPGEGNATWALSLSGTMAWTRLNPAGWFPGERGAHGAVFDVARNRMVVFGGGLSTWLDDTWALAWDPPVPTGVPTVPTPVAFALGPARPNPAARHLAISFTLAKRGPATLELLDVTGRRLLTHAVGDLGVGSHEVELDRDIVGLETGVYLVHLRQGARTAASKICIVR
jgi:hypothetical protein